MKNNSKLLKTLLALFSIGSVFLVIGVVVIIMAIYHYGQDLPEYSKLKDYKPPIMTRLYAGDGSLIAEYASEKRIFVPIHAIPKHVIYAFLSAEDKNYFSHKGIDFVGVLRATVNNVKNIQSGRRLEGASTITQQVAKNFLLTGVVSIERKVKEAILAFRIEKAFSKQHILELYLNEIFLGNRSYGVAAAALNYFDKSLDELTLDEAALLASLPKAPSRFDPFRNPERAIERRDWVLGRLAEDDRITSSQAELAQKQPITLKRPDRSKFVSARYFAEDVRRELIAEYGDDIIYLGGLSVRTSLDPELQNHAISALRKGLEAYDHRHGYRGKIDKVDDMSNWHAALKEMTRPENMPSDWHMAVVLSARSSHLEIGLKDGLKGRVALKDLAWARKSLKRGLYLGPEINGAHKVATKGDVVLVMRKETKDDTASTDYALKQIPNVEGALVAMDPHTGRILAMQGGYKAGVSGFNRVTQAKRQPGSAMKPFVYLAALDQGFTPSNLVLDAPFVIEQGYGLPKWRPANYSNEFYGPTPIRVGLEKSKNLMTVRLAYHLGMDVIADYAKRFGFDTNMQKTLAMSLGAGETTLLDLVSSYAILVNGGKRVQPNLIDRIQDRNGKTVYKKQNQACIDCTDLVEFEGQDPNPIEDKRLQVSDPRTSYQIVSMLEGVVQRGTATRLKKLNRPLAGKTGTTNNSKDAWFIGFSPDLVVGVFVGFDEPRTLGKRETGSSTAAPIFGDFMEKALKGKPIIPFRMPDGLQLVRVNPKTGRPTKSGEVAIWESFLPGTEPNNQQYILDKSGLNLMVGNDPNSAKGSAVIGTGGLY